MPKATQSNITTVNWQQTGERLRTARLLFKLTETEAAQAAGVTLKTWRAWEAGGRQRSIGPILKLGRQYRISIDWLFCGGLGIFYVDLLSDPPKAEIRRSIERRAA
jgi:transcriptional regulator with XRE-family HTH domain